MSHPNNQHYVARLYLRQFAYEIGTNPHICAFDKTTRTVIRPSIRNVAAELHFYESSDMGVERALSKIEEGFVPAYRLLREADNVAPLGPRERAAIAVFLAVQQVRTVEFRSTLKSMTDELKKWLAIHHIQADPAYTTITEEDCRDIQVRSFLTLVPELATVMAQMKWIRIRNRTSMPFWTSDHPITPFNPRQSGLTGNLGLTCRGIQVFFPLAPTAALCLCDPIDYGALPEDDVTDDLQHVIFQNDLQVRSSTRFVFSNNSNFSLAQRVLNDHPEFADPGRRRMQALGVP